MTITTIATHVRPGTQDEVARRMAPALAMAEAFGAHLCTVVFAIEGDESLEDSTAAQAEAMAAQRGLRGEVRTRSSFAFGAGEVFADQARVSDMAVVCLDLRHSMPSRMLFSAVAFGSGRPVLVVPEATGFALPPRRVLVGWDASPAAARAVAGALPFIRQAEETIVATVTDDRTLRPGQSGIELTHLLARHGAQASFAPVAANGAATADALAGHARERGAELLVLGLVRHAPLHDLIYGSATDTLLQGGLRLPCLVAA